MLSLHTCFQGKAGPCVSVCEDKHQWLGCLELGTTLSEAAVLRYSGLPSSKNAWTPYPPKIKQNKTKISPFVLSFKGIVQPRQHVSKIVSVKTVLTRANMQL